MLCNIGAEAIPISIGSLLGFSSGRSFSIWLLVVNFIISFSIGLSCRADTATIPALRQASNVTSYAVGQLSLHNSQTKYFILSLAELEPMPTLTFNFSFQKIMY
jgi:hypothetical protein